MDSTPFTPRNAVKFVITAAVNYKATVITKDVLTDYTRFEDDDIVVKVAGGLVGWYVSDKVKPYSDKLVDKTADFIIAKREARTAKKETEETQ